MTVALLVVGLGAATAVFLFFASGMLVAVLFGEAGAGPAPEGEFAEGAGETTEFAADAPSVSRVVAVDWRSVGVYYVVGVCVWSVVALLAVALS